MTNKTQVHIEKKKGKYGIEYSLASAPDGPCPGGFGPTLKSMFKMEFPTSVFGTYPLEIAHEALKSLFYDKSPVYS